MNVRAFFQRTIEITLSRPKRRSLQVHLNDVIVISKSLEDYIVQSHEVLHTLFSVGLCQAARLYALYRDLWLLCHIERQEKSLIFTKNLFYYAALISSEPSQETIFSLKRY